ncbi:MAG TPA: iron chelate uptake ABC transporter family permease subunit [Xanthobacteraceae bacterium]|nr:iron chelate uptake ABC transporter family permease subunit [Xanthobacteraceae bacterium]
MPVSGASTRAVSRRAARPFALRGVRGGPAGLLAGLALVLVAAALAAALIGAAGIPITRLPAVMGLATGDPDLVARDRLILGAVRLPRVALAAAVGALLGVSGAIMQGLFRNPLADPGLIGVSAGAALSTAAMIVIGERIVASSGTALPLGTLPAAAFVGGLVTTAVLYRLATCEGRTAVAVLLLAGIAVGALAMAGLGLLIFLADDRQLRDIQFWMLGSLGGATWDKALALAPVLAAVCAALPFFSRGLDVLALGEAEAFHMGIEVQRLKRWAVVSVAAAVGASVAFSGVVGFIGIVVPHLVRLAAGPGHRLVLPGSLLLGAALLLAADTVARIVAAPAELPIGIVTALVGAPFFLALLLRRRVAGL